MNNAIGFKIKKHRESLGISQDAMAYELDMTQSNYGRLEKDDSRLNVPKLKKIAEVLNFSIGLLFDEENARMINPQHDGIKTAYKAEDLIRADKEHIISLKEEILFLRKLLEAK